MKALILFVAIILLCNGCKKENLSVNCSAIYQGAIINDKNKVGEPVQSIIQSLPSQEYTIQNFELLVNKLSQQCNLQVLWKCFDCVQTLPSQSEIRITNDSVRTQFQKTIDISYTSDNKMKFLHMHD